MLKKIVVVGNGKLANAIMEFANENSLPSKIYPYEIAPWTGKKFGQKSLNWEVVVHAGSGRQYIESLEYARDNRCIYIQAATENKITVLKPERPNFIFINAPNLSIMMVKAIYLTKQLGQLFEGNRKELTESHQAEKKSVSGTAIKIAQNLGIKESQIRSIRDPGIQAEELNITNLKRHALHRIRIYREDGFVEITTKIEGIKSYVNGLFVILKAAANLDAGLYEIEDLIEMNRI